MKSDPELISDETSEAPALESAASHGHGLRSGKFSWLAFGIGMVVLGGVAALLLNQPYYLSLGAVGLLFAALASAWNIIGGYGGQFSLAHAVFFAVGGYSVALTQVNWKWAPWPGLLLGIVLSTILAALLAWPLFRLRGPFFAIGTLALSVVVLALVTWMPWTGAALGLQIPFNEQPITSRPAWAFIFLGFLAVCVAVSLVVSRGRLGFYLVAVRDDQEAASAAGASALWVKTLGFAISAGLTGLGGGLYVMYLGFLDPPTFLDAVQIGAFIPLCALIGGLGTIVGPIIGGLVLPTLQTYMRGAFSNLPAGVSEAILGLVLILVALFFRAGIWGWLTSLVRRVMSRRAKSDERANI
ncbi:MAG: livM [Microbacteriaceae bacterium]|nr:livM [Microbacteriaceae bacterium]